MIIDANAYCGHWPFRRLSHAGAAGLSALMQRTGTDQALVSPIAAAFYRDCLSAMEEMLDDPGWDGGRMSPLASVNPAFPGWRADLRTMVEQLGCRALRLLSNYHGYSLFDDQAQQLVTQAMEWNLPVIITIRMQDERSHHWHMLVNPVSLDEVRFLLRQHPEGRYMLSNITWAEVRALRPELELVADWGWEMSYKPPPFYIEQAVGEFGAEHVLYGSAAPLQYPESLLLVVQQAGISEDDRQLVLSGNAQRLFGLGGQG